MMRATLALIRAQFIEIRRSKTALFWMTAFPLGFLLLFGFVMARSDARVMAFMMPGLLTTTLMSGSLFGVAFPLVQQRETGLLRRLRVTPVPAAAVAIAHGVTSVVIGLLSLIVLMILARLIFGMQMAGSWPSLIVVYLCGACALVPMGLLVGSTARDIRTAPAIANLLFFPLMFLSGSAFPFAMLPEGVKRFARVLPTTYLNESYAGVIVAGESIWPMAGTLAVLVATGARRHRPDVDAVSMGRHGSDSAAIARDHRRRVCGDARRVGAGGAGIQDGRDARHAPHRSRRGAPARSSCCAAPPCSMGSAAASPTPAW